MTKRIKLPIYAFIGIMMSMIMLAGCIIHVGASDGESKYSYSDGQNYSSTNKSVSVKANQTIDDVSSVNGSVTIADGVVAKEVSNVNGRIRIGDNVSVESVSMVNGSITIGEGFKAEEDVETVNGNISINRNSEVGGNIESVNGNFNLTQVLVKENLITVNGSMSLLDGTVIEGDVKFEGKPSRNNNWRSRPATLKVDKTSNIKGKIIVYKEVEFDFADDSLMEKVERRY